MDKEHSEEQVVSFPLNIVDNTPDQTAREILDASQEYKEVCLIIDCLLQNPYGGFTPTKLEETYQAQQMEMSPLVKSSPMWQNKDVCPSTKEVADVIIKLGIIPTWPILAISLDGDDHSFLTESDMEYLETK
jgi:hypothetical protein